MSILFLWGVTYTNGILIVTDVSLENLKAFLKQIHVEIRIYHHV